jgi:hypothetical protein
MWFENKWMQLEDIMLGEVSQAEKDKGCMFSLICGRQIQRVNIYTKTNMIIFKLIAERVCNTATVLWNLGKEERKRE